MVWKIAVHIDDNHADAKSSTIGNLQGLFSIIVVSILFFIDDHAISVYYWEQTRGVCFPSQTC